MRLIFITFLCFSFNCYAQFRFEGTVAITNNSTIAYLSLVEDYRKTSRVYHEQIIKKTKVDSLGYFVFEGNNLNNENRIYRIHINSCIETSSGSHLNPCENQESILFIANNSDHIYFPLNQKTNESFCTIESTNSKSALLLEMEEFKEQMFFDFSEFHSATNLKMNAEKWFSHFQDFGKQCEEPLAELYCYSFLSDRTNETYTHYLKDLSESEYYQNLQHRLNRNYPKTEFSKQYQAEIKADVMLLSNKNDTSYNFKWILSILLGLSVLANLYFLRKLQLKSNNNTLSTKTLTSQEQKIVSAIIAGKSNKEIATDLFISVSTVKTHINNLYKKLGVRNREDLKNLHK